MADDSRNELDQYEQCIDQQARLCPANAPAGRAVHIADALEVRSLQPTRCFIDASCICLRVLARYALGYDEIGILRRIRGRCIDEEIAATRHHCGFESLDRGDEVVELSARLPPREEHTFLSNTTGQLERGTVTFFAAMRVEVFLLLLKGFLSHTSSVLRFVPLNCKSRDSGVKAATLVNLRRGENNVARIRKGRRWKLGRSGETLLAAAA